MNPSGEPQDLPKSYMACYCLLPAHGYLTCYSIVTRTNPIGEPQGLPECYTACYLIVTPSLLLGCYIGACYMREVTLGRMLHPFLAVTLLLSEVMQKVTKKDRFTAVLCRCYAF